jgi:threonine/homoserine/homoserine lactone efflux protein
MAVATVGGAVPGYDVLYVLSQSILRRIKLAIMGRCS